MSNWALAGLILATMALIAGGVVMFWPVMAVKRHFAPRRDMRTTWKVVKLGEPLLEGFGLIGKIEYGVVISSDEMLAQTQTLLFCPLFSGVDKSTSAPLAILPWHVQVEIRSDPDRHNVDIDYGRKYVSTKIVLPIAAGEIDMDGLERGYLDEHSRVLVAKKLSIWMPSFTRIAHS